MANITILVGTVYGAASKVEALISSQLQQMKHQVIKAEIQDVTSIVSSDAVLVITSTTGQGDIPNNLMPWYLQAKDKLPLISGIPFGVIALGDSSYQNFCGAGEKMQEFMFELQGTSPLPMIKIDACETLEPETLALPWLKDWLEVCQL